MRVETIREMMRLRELGLSHRDIAISCGVAKSTVYDYLKVFASSGVEFVEAVNLSDEELLHRLNKKSSRGEQKLIAIDFARVSRELTRKGVTLKLIWEEQFQSGEISYGTFCLRYKKYKNGTERSMIQEHIAGEKLFVDFSGLTVRYYPGNGKEEKAEIFVATHGVSNYTFAFATKDQSALSWQSAHIHAFKYFGGVSKLLVPDNLKSGVVKADRYEPTINEAYRRLASYYGTAILPTRVSKPKDKAKVEKAVLDVQRQVLAPLRDRRFYSVSEINQAIFPLLESFNSREMKTYGKSRIELFNELDKPQLKPLPDVSYSVRESKIVKVHKDYHIQFERNNYSVPYWLIGKEVRLEADENLVTIYYGNKEVAVHRRSYESFKQIWVKEHLCKEHQAVKNWTIENFVKWGAKVGAHTHELFSNIIGNVEYPVLAMRTLLGIRRYLEPQLERAEAISARANNDNVTTVKGVKFIIENGLDKIPMRQSMVRPMIPQHSNLRGADDFK